MKRGGNAVDGDDDSSASRVISLTWWAHTSTRFVLTTNFP